MRLLLLFLVMGQSVWALSSRGDAMLRGHWPLAGDVRDRSGQGRHGHNHGADLTAAGPSGQPGSAAAFAGRGWIEIPDGLGSLGSEDFTLAVRVYTAAPLDRAGGDVLCLYDPVTRRGFNLGLLTLTGTTSSQPNVRNLHFGIDQARLEATWRDHGRPGQAVFIMALAVHDDHLFAATCEAGRGEAGRVYRLEGEQRWIDCGRPDGSNAVTSLAVFRGQLYAGTGKYRLGGSALGDSENQQLGGRVFRYEGEGRWSPCGRVSAETEAIGGLVVFNDALYASSLYAPAGLFRYEGGERWTALGSHEGRRPVALATYDGRLYASSYDGAWVFEFDGRRFVSRGQVGDNTQTYGFVQHRGNLHVATWPSGRMYRWDGNTAWIDAGRLGEEREVMATAHYNGKLYAGTLPLAKVFRYDEGTRWTDTGQLDATPDVTYRRVWSMAVYRGRLFAGTLPAGRVRSLAAGVNVTVDRPLESGWRHLAAVRRGDRLEVYIDGHLQARSEAFRPADFDLGDHQPLRIGAGEHTPFVGKMSDLRIYARALAAAEIAALSTAR